LFTLDALGERGEGRERGKERRERENRSPISLLSPQSAPLITEKRAKFS